MLASEVGLEAGYRRGYEFAKSASVLAHRIKIAGLVIAGLVFVEAFLSAQSEVVIVSRFIIALSIFGAAVLQAIVIDSLAHVVRATYDTAVNTSPFIVEQEKRRILGVSALQRQA
jgi:hypothetical protein